MTQYSLIFGIFNIFFRDPTVEITPNLFYPLGSSKSDLRHCRPPTVATYVSVQYNSWKSN